MICLQQSVVWDLVVNNSSKIYKYISSLSSGRQLPSIVDNKQASTSFDQAQLFNQFFHSVFTHSSCDFPIPPDPLTNGVTSSNIDISPTDVFQALYNLDPNKAPGIDSINPALLKYTAESLTVPIHHPLILSLQSNFLPQEWHVHTAQCQFLNLVIVPLLLIIDRSCCAQRS